MLAANGTIERVAFRSCNSLKSVTLPWGGDATVLSTNCFQGCSSLRRLKFEGPPPASYPPDLFTGDVETWVNGPQSMDLRIYASSRQNGTAWRAFATRAPSDSEKSHFKYPGSKTFGILTYNYVDHYSAPTTRFQWLVWEKSCWDPEFASTTIILK